MLLMYAVSKYDVPKYVLKFLYYFLLAPHSSKFKGHWGLNTYCPDLPIAIAIAIEALEANTRFPFRQNCMPNIYEHSVLVT
eukprot:scaffold17154_cov86-Skeletonema_dohrnii-CCMP3373.AAC.2